MVCIVSVGDKRWVVSLAMTSSNMLEKALDLVDSAIEDQREHQNC